MLCPRAASQGVSRKFQGFLANGTLEFQLSFTSVAIETTEYELISLGFAPAGRCVDNDAVMGWIDAHAIVG